MLCLTNTQCEDDDLLIVPNNCDLSILIDSNAYDNSVSSEFAFVSVNIIDGNCLFIEFSASGCDGDSWEFELIDSGAVAESLPEQRFLKFELTNNEACLAVFERSTSFDLIPLQVEGSNEILLNIDGLNEPVVYSY